MTEEQKLKSIKILLDLISKHPSMRKFAHVINEDQGDISRCTLGYKSPRARMVVNICREYPNICPHDLNPDIFPKDLKFIFKQKKGD